MLSLLGAGLLLLAMLALSLGVMAYFAPVLDENGHPVPSPGLSAVAFAEHTVVFAKDQPEYKPLPAVMFPDDPQGQVITCWRLSRRDRIRVLLSGRLWCSVLTFHQPLQPLYFTVLKSDVIRQAEGQPAA